MNMRHPSRCASAAAGHVQLIKDNPMETDLATRIASLPQHQELKAKRRRFGWSLTLAILLDARAI